jgi:hypothetical protein
MNQRDLDAIEDVLVKLAEAIAQRLDAIEERVKELEREPRKSLRQQLREKGITL